MEEIENLRYALLKALFLPQITNWFNNVLLGLSGKKYYYELKFGPRVQDKLIKKYL